MAVLMGVPTECTAGLDEPCASASEPGRPAGFYCQWESTHGSVFTGPVAAWPSANTFSGQVFGYKVAVNCSLPAEAAYRRITAGGEDLDPLPESHLTLSIVHFIKRAAEETVETHGVALPFAGEHMGNNVAFIW